MKRDFYSELNEEKFKKVTYTIYNKMDDENYITLLEKTFGEPFSVEDFKYYDFELTEKERFLIKMHNKEYLNNIKDLKNKLKIMGVKVYTDFNFRKCESC